MPRSGRGRWDIRTVYSQGPGHQGPVKRETGYSMRPQRENGAVHLEGESILGDEMP